MRTYFIRVYPQKTEIKPIAIYIKIRFASHSRRVRLSRVDPVEPSDDDDKRYVCIVCDDYKCSIVTVINV